MKRKRRDGESAPMTLAQALGAKVRLIVWGKTCQHQAEPDIVEQAASYGADTTVIDWAAACAAQPARAARWIWSSAARHLEPPLEPPQRRKPAG
jgi:hypothetical protein